eukprot:TRINITY_DN7250_c0_g1_i1.p1 TRINITY_DN7250_c0_g1~~TRINITY_DN7250_c0_g1_i1.p1  ORF type:complete len:128 (+),score=30.24 TRINITY_DN7250_c0_g1_i1:104-487(+)
MPHGAISALLALTEQVQPIAEHPTPLSVPDIGGLSCCSGSTEFHPIQMPLSGNGNSSIIPLWDPSDDSDLDFGEEFALPPPPVPQLQHAPVSMSSISPLDTLFLLDVPSELAETPIKMQMHCYMHLH